MSRAVIVDGSLYPTVVAASDALGLPLGRLKRALVAESRGGRRSHSGLCGRRREANAARQVPTMRLRDCGTAFPTDWHGLDLIRPGGENLRCSVSAR